MGALHQPTEKTRAQVAALVSFGNTHEEIARFIDISADTLVKHYKHELETSAIFANAEIATRLYQIAKGGDTKAMMFWLKTRARWREKDRDDEQKNFNSLVEKMIDKLAD